MGNAIKALGAPLKSLLFLVLMLPAPTLYVLAQHPPHEMLLVNGNKSNYMSEDLL